MARFPPIQFPDTEYNAFDVSRRFTPPFYIKTLQGLYDKEENACYSAEQVYVIVHKVKIKSVVATVREVSLKIPLNYEGKFSIIGQRSSPLNMKEIIELFNLETSLVEVRISDLAQHGKHFLDTIDNIGRGIRTCNFKLTKETTDEYFIGRSPEDSTVIIFSTTANMAFQVKETNAKEVQFLLFDEKELKYDVFVTDVRLPAIKFFTTNEAFYLRPKLPPKPMPHANAATEKSVVNPTKQSKRRSDKEFVQSFNNGGKDVHILLSRNQPPLPPPKTTALTSSIRKKTPPPLPASHPYPSDDDNDPGVGHLAQDSPRFPPLSKEHTQKPSTPPLPPRLNVELDTDDEYDAKLTDATSKGYDHADSDSGHDYDQPMSDDGQDYELVGPPMLMPDNIRKKNAISPSLPKSPNAIKKSFGQLTEQIRKFNLTRQKQPSGDMADDELTEDPYAEQKLEAQRKTFRKRPARNRNDPLPSPASQSIPSPTFSSGASPLSSPVSKRPHATPQQTVESDSDSLSDYEKIDDDIELPGNTPRRPPIPTPIKLPGAEPRLHSRQKSTPNPPSRSSIPGNPQQPLVKLPDQGFKSDPRLPSHQKSTPNPPSRSSIPGNPQQPLVKLPDQGFKSDPRLPSHQKSTPNPPSRSSIPGNPQQPLVKLPDQGFKSDPRLPSHQKSTPNPPSRSSIPGYPQPSQVKLPDQGFKSDTVSPLKGHSNMVNQVTLPDKSADERSEPSSHKGNVAVVQPAPKQPHVATADDDYEFPTDVCNLGVEGIANALQHLKIPEETIETFREAQIDGQIFVCLDESILDELGVNGFYKLKIIRFKNGWRPKLD